MIERRGCIAGMGAAILVGSLGPPAWAQTRARPLVGVLFHSNPEPTLAQFRAALAALGYRDGSTIQLDVRVADGSDARLAAMAGELVAAKVDVIVAVTTPAGLAAKAATTSIPIVLGVVADPVGSGLVASLSKPGGNITGVSGAVAELSGKILGLLREAIPTAGRIGVIVNVADPFHVRLVNQIEEANRSVRVDLRVFRVTAPGEVASAFAEMAAQHMDAVIVQPTLPRVEVVAQAFQYRIPSASPLRGYAEAGGLFSYNGKASDMFAVVAGQVERVLKGARPGDMPVEQPTKFELVLNLKTAKALGLEISPTLLAQADEVIE